MKPLRYLIFLLLLNHPVSAESVGIQFDQMPIGTTLVTETIEKPKKVLEQKYVGEEGGLYVMEERQSKESDRKF